MVEAEAVDLLVLAGEPPLELPTRPPCGTRQLPAVCRGQRRAGAGNDTVIDDTDRAVGINAVETADGAAGFVGDRTLRQQDVLGRLQNLESQKVNVLASTMWWALALPRLDDKRRCGNHDILSGEAGTVN